jgi:hypothetical protein
MADSCLADYEGIVFGVPWTVLEARILYRKEQSQSPKSIESCAAGYNSANREIFIEKREAWSLQGESMYCYL